MSTVTINGFDVVVTTLDNPAWLTRCLNSLLGHTGPVPLSVHVSGSGGGEVIRGFGGDPRLVDVPRKEAAGSSWRDHVLAALEQCQRPLVVFLHDDVLVLPGNPAWIERLMLPFTTDPFVAVTCATLTNCRFIHQRASTALSPGYYYTNSFMPIAFMARRDVIQDAIERVPEDKYMDQELSLNLIERGWKIVMATNLCLYHEGMQTYGRLYRDKPDWFDEWERAVKADVPGRHLASWCARMDHIEMIPMKNALIWRGSDVSVLYG